MTLIPFDERDGVIWLDGQLVNWRDAKVHILTHALHYGSSVFEGLRMYEGEIFKLQEHSERLIRSAKLLGFDIPYSVEEINQACLRAVRVNNLEDAYVRPVAWRGTEQMGVSAPLSKIHLAVAAWEWPSYFSPELQEKGIKLQTSRWRRPSPDTAPTASKAAGLYMICTLSKHAADDAGYHDALMLDWRGQVAEATGANFFMVKDGVLYTPPVDCILDGITRRTVIDLAREHHITVVERAIWPDELDSAEEIFLTGSAAEVTAVGQIDQKIYKVGAVTRTLRDAYQKLVRAHKNKQAAA
ncbi:MAG: branched-chain amino acid aminotransferase [Alphaproteobacteria bacterium]